jgi:hypothetical protein
MKALFIGAGSTYECGMPLVWELTAEIRRWMTPTKLINLNENWKAQGGGWCNDVLDRLIELLENKDLHYENIIGAIEVECSRERNESIRSDYHSALGYLLQAVYGLLLERQIRNNSYALSALSDFENLTLLANENKPLWIFSLNHDCIIEMLASKTSIPLKSGFDETISLHMSAGIGSANKVEFERLSRESINKNNYDFFKHGEFGINLIKLHGALDIFGHNDALDYLKIKPTANNLTSYAHQLQLINQINQDIAVRDRISCLNEIVYEDENGEINFLRKSLLSGAHKFSNKISQIAPSEFLSLFKGNLNYASELICIGYSFGDKHIDDQIIEWMSFLKSRRLTIVNPGISHSPDRFKHLAGQVQCLAIGASDYFLQLGTGEFTMLQNMLRKLRKAGREKIRRELLDNP